ncbi:class I SAM-dependent methyltransferase [Curtobacterium sp. Csp1]|uniref:class I SAM-dependent methyltransferase n=1 Tax=Curtobacterium sp. Csp1 TaxID=2495429 RepID=UPI0015973C87|nr:class I SAM-dependent methyltransferase [Curtobacterium sp. Csp1]QKS20494.1 class I SAM-dependent methyltransferase [Curtobacterium sp. Csp1]
MVERAASRVQRADERVQRADERVQRADERVQRAYAARADEYAAVLGSMEAVHVADRTHVEQWAAGCHGVVVDAGCGPGHWTAHLAGLGHRVVGLDVVPEFVAIARRTAPGVEVRRATLESTGLPAGSVGGVLSWYSLVHHEPDAVPVALAEFHRVLDAGGGLLVGAFAGAVLEPFDHAVTTWSRRSRTRGSPSSTCGSARQRGAGGVMSPAVAAGGRQGCQPGVARPVS